MTLWIETSLLKDIGSYQIDMFESDSKTGKNVTYHVIVEVYERLSDDAQAEKLASSWYDDMLLKNRKKVSDKDEFDALTAKVLELTPTGKLTIVFSKPIILPPIEIGKSIDEH